MASVRVWQSMQSRSLFAFGELGDGLVIIVQTIGGEVWRGLEGHRAQVIVAAIVAGIALGIRDGGGQLVDLGGCAGVDAGQVGGLGGGMAGGTAGEMVITSAWSAQVGRRGDR